MVLCGMKTRARFERRRLEKPGLRDRGGLLMEGTRDNTGSIDILQRWMLLLAQFSVGQLCLTNRQMDLPAHRSAPGMACHVV